jgi:ATP-dependent exoDNAse (exonuclease V) alpha subunit
MAIEINEEFLRALEVLNAGSSVFITGKAGTGKSTLLRYYLERTVRPTVISAPTGVAALNVGGETVHRVFGFTPTVTREFAASSEYKPNAKTRGLLRAMETLVVDEVSMVRADLLDAMDASLRRFGPIKNAPFGGVQMVFVGDPYQLPPVVTESEEQFFRTYYPTPFFFSADALRELDFTIVELQKIYRQSDDTFISLLNAVRTGDADQGVFDALNTRYDPDFDPPADEFWVTLTTTNKMADSVNQKRLDALDAELHVSEAAISGTVEDNDKAVPEILEYKVGAQIMLVANDRDGRYVNGSMAVITDTFTDRNGPVVLVELMDSEEEVAVRPHTWDITRAVVEGGKITYTEVGTYRQLPFKPAWAVTIHKSQGLSLPEAMIDVRAAREPGQAYVALSRVRSLQGLHLKEMFGGLWVSPEAVEFHRRVDSEASSGGQVGKLRLETSI